MCGVSVSKIYRPIFFHKRITYPLVRAVASPWSRQERASVRTPLRAPRPCRLGMLVPLLARVLDPRAGVAVCAAPLAGGPCRSVLMHAPAGGDAFRRASGGSASSGGGESSSAGRGRSADSEWSELLDCLRAYQADTADTPGTPGTAGAPDTPDTPGACFRVPTQFVVPSRAPYARRSWGDALGKRTSRLASQARQGTLRAERRRDLEAVGLDLRSARERGFDELVLALGAYRAAYGDCNVPSGFVVPSDAPWPPACWAMPLGNPQPRPHPQP